MKALNTVKTMLHSISFVFFLNYILPEVLMLSPMLIVNPICVHFIFMLSLPCINIHLTKITQLINDNVSCDFFPPMTPRTLHS